MFPPRRAIASVLPFCLALAFAACGIKGPPQPPLRKIIPTVDDLSATLVGSEVRLSWTPHFRYADGTEMQLGGVLIWRLDEDLAEQLRLQQEELERSSEVSADDASAATRLPPLGAVNLLARRIGRLPIADFRRRASLVAELRIEQLLDLADHGKIRWSERLPLPPQEFPSGRCVYAVVESDARGRRSAFSNTVSILPLTPPPPPSQLNSTLTQEQLRLNWAYPERPDLGSRQLAAVGFNVYKADAGEPSPLAPVNTTLIPTSPPTGWQPYRIIAHQQLEGSEGRFAYLFATSESPSAAGISQTLIPADEMDSFRGAAIEAEVVMSSPGGSCSGRLILDLSRDPRFPEQEPAGAEVFSDEENPLIVSREIEIGETPQRFTVSAAVAVDARAIVLKIEPRGVEPISAPFILESVVARLEGSPENLVTNGDFDAFPQTSYVEPISEFSGSCSYRVTAVYSVGAFTIESEPTAPRTVELRDTFPPSAPGSVRALATAEAIAVTWTGVRVADLGGYIVFRRDGEEGPWQRLTERPITVTVYRDTDVLPGVIYFYRLQAVDSAGNRSDFTEEVSATLAQR